MLDSGGRQRKPKSKEPMTGEFEELHRFSRLPPGTMQRGGVLEQKEQSSLASVLGCASGFGQG